MNKPPARLQKCDSYKVLEEQLSISSKQIIFLLLFVLIFGALCFICKGPTYGVL